MRAQDYTRDLAAHGRYHFSTEEAVDAIGGNAQAVRAQLLRLREKGLVAQPVRGFHVIVPPEYQSLGCLPAEQFLDPLLKGEPYYIALLSAAERHGAAHQRPQATQVILSRNRPRIECGGVHVDFIARKDLDRMPVVVLNTPRGTVRYATPEVTALELVGYPGHAGGMNNVATVISELAEDLSPEKLIEVARLSPVSWSQRLGYLLELAGQSELVKELSAYVHESARSFTPLRRAAGMANGKRIQDWKLIVNVNVEADA